MYEAALTCALALAGCSATEPEKPGWADSDCSSFRMPRELWKTGKPYAEGTAVTYRQLIADQLVQCRTLHGMRFSAVRELLGKADEVGRHPLEAVYWIGDERSLFVIDSESLYIRFDARRRVTSVEIGQD